MDSEKRIKDAIIKVGELKVRNAFLQSTFVYGTQGKGSTVVKALRLFNTQRKPGADPKAGTIGRDLNLFEPGRRVGAYVGGGHQMMDMYYGQGGNSIHAFRDPVIAEYVHWGMGYTKPFTMNLSGRDSYMEHFSTKDPKTKQAVKPEEGWKATELKNYGVDSVGKNMTATKEISRLIRAGIRQFGGTLIFEGRDVFYSQVFLKNPPYAGDTDLEARELFQYFVPNASRAQFGKGKIVFHWNGVETIPTKYHFMSNWKFAADAEKSMLLHAKQNVQDANFAGVGCSAIWNNFADVPAYLRGLDLNHVEKRAQAAGINQKSLV